ncbi:aldehyde:ferredoxin oxidoreductase [Dethiosulfatibacter aminovorans DSM 17477]|uniref:Aldehyde:ferredoxin oxidoreductase n=1 Tax=Dethiosulfatibacter aminovorans DSM 17477 TaxID=1121476 RepID=A0A1M6JN27_9FIRM|nr:aldehyde ferredoxin oxidoreductase C-terminal domain-containing protein [Dethiosulfatibacter aminovorans]SHJ48137.1 aldehyde:ferredoxin oxidoreductase [Dethiosulfatibacter aminovorans DSM 17477]
MNKIYRINMRSKEIKEDMFDSSMLLGNRGLTAKIVSEEVNPTCDPLGSGNKLVLATGILAGSGVTTTGRLSFGGKSPLTNTIKESNVGGSAGAEMAKHGIKMFVIEDQPETDTWYILRIDENSNVSLEEGTDYQGFNSYKTTEMLKEKYGSKSSICVIGKAGERKLLSASIQVTDNSTGHPARAAGRGGLGALMGSKGLKAIVLEKAKSRNKLEIVDKDKFNEGKKSIINFIKESPITGVGLALLGTMAYVDVTAESNIIPVNNFSGKMINDEQKEKICANAFADRAKMHGGRSGVACQPGCIIRCSNIVNNEQGEMITSGLEYETAALFGPNCGIYDYDFLVEADRICDEFGVDTIDVANAVAVTMDAGELEWGDKEAVLDLLKEMIEGSSELGVAIGNGTAATGELLKHNRVPVCKNQGLAAYDPRNLQGMGVQYASCTQGADHTGGHPMTVEGVDHTNPEGQVDLMKNIQVPTALCDNLMCLFAFTALATPEALEAIAKSIEGALGIECDVDRLMQIGVETIKMEREFNEKAGFRPEDDVLPEFFYKEKNASGNVFGVKKEELAAMWK